jgi:polysaccharide export outer membrane protein
MFMKVITRVNRGHVTLASALWLLLASLISSSLIGSPSSVALAQQQPPAAVTPQTTASSSGGKEDYRIGADDVLDIRVFNKPLLSRDTIHVSAQGTISMPLIQGDIIAVCKTEKQLAAEIAHLYLDYLRNPQVYVTVKEYKSRPVAVIGAVHTPGQFQLQRRVRLLELLALAGGYQDRAGSTIEIFHGGQLSPSCAASSDITTAADDSIPISYYNLSQTLHGEEQSNPYLLPGDIITIRDADQAYIVGNVLRPMSVPLKEEITVSQAIAMAGGIMPDTRSEKVRIIRKLSGREGKTEIFVDLKAIEKHQATDLALKANDIVDVPTSGGKRFLRTLLGTVAPSIGQLPIRVIP